jgi:glutathione S-transferase
MLRYIASLPGKVQLMPTDPISQLKVNEVMGLSADFEREWAPCVYMAMMPEKYGYDPEYKKTEEGKESVKKLRETFLSTSFPRFLKYYEDFINESNDAFLCGPEITIADCVVVPQLVRYTLGFIDYVPKDSLEKTNPKVAAYVNRFLAVPEVKEWYDSSKK